MPTDEALDKIALDWANGKLTVREAIDAAYSAGYSEAMLDDQQRGQRPT